MKIDIGRLNRRSYCLQVPVLYGGLTAIIRFQAEKIPPDI